jgi:hypothetical protein
MCDCKKKGLCASCPHHQISDQLLIQYFYEGLLPMNKSMINVASGGALVDKTLHAARNLNENIAANTQQFGTEMEGQSRVVNETPLLQINKESKIDWKNLIHWRDNWPSNNKCKVWRSYVEFVPQLTIILTNVQHFKKLHLVI